MEFYYKNIASFTFNLWEIRGCHLGDNRFLVFRTCSLRFFSPFFTSCFLPLSLLPPLFAFFNFTTPVSTCCLLSVSFIVTWVSCIQNSPKKARPTAWSPCRTELLTGLRWRQMAAFDSAAPPYPAWHGQLQVAMVQSMTACDKEPFDPIFQKGTASVASDPNTVDARQTPSRYNDLFIVEHLLNHSTFSNTLILLWAIYMFRSKKCPFLENWWTKGNNSFLCFLEQNC